MYDKECLERYGIRTCVIVEVSPDTFEVRLLDNRYLTEKKVVYLVKRDKLFEIIPKKLMYKYTVVIAEVRSNNKEITAVHLPVQHQLTTPPILQ
jgi:hypothetical protein